MAYTRDDFELIYRRCFARAMGLAIALLHDEEDARDVVQEVFARLWESRVTIDNPDAFILRSVRNGCLNHIGKLTTHERIRRLLPLDDEGIELPGDDKLAAVRQAASTLLSERESEAVHEVFTLGNSYKEAARQMDVTVATVNKHIVGALRKLRNHFKTKEL